MKPVKNKKTGKWDIQYHYFDIEGNYRKTSKRGFRTKKEAEEWYRDYKHSKDESLNMSFERFVQIYYTDMKSQIREYTWLSKEMIIETKILPYFKDMKVNEIKPKDILKWQNWIKCQKNKQGNPYSPTYLRSINSQLSAIFNFACNYYNLSSNPCKKVKSMGKKKRTGEIKFWTTEQYKIFSEAMMEKPLSFYAFEMLYWCGIRLGELLALTPADFDFDKKTVSISKSYQRINGRDVITPPKTDSSIRKVLMPDKLCDEMQDCINSIYGINSNMRIFTITKSYLTHEMERGCKATGVPKIRIHDLRHSAVSLLIDKGYSAVAIAERVGHSSAVETLEIYSHLFPTVQTDMANKLNEEMNTCV